MLGSLLQLQLQSWIRQQAQPDSKSAGVHSLHGYHYLTLTMPVVTILQHHLPLPRTLS